MAIRTPTVRRPRTGRGRVARIMLRTIPAKGEHDRSIFDSETHAREWASQKFVTDEKYQIALVTAWARPCCGALEKIVTVKLLKPSEFLARRGDWILDPGGRGHQPQVAGDFWNQKGEPYEQPRTRDRLQKTGEGHESEDG